MINDFAPKVAYFPRGDTLSRRGVVILPLKFDMHAIKRIVCVSRDLSGSDGDGDSICPR